MLRPPAVAQKSMKTAIRESLLTQAPPDDFGLFAGTLIMPSGANKPSIFRLPRQRLKLEWLRLVKRSQNLASLLIMKYSLPKPRPKIKFLATARVAQALHSQMYNAFADGDIPTLNTICLASLQDSFRRRLAQRPPKATYRWTLHQHRRRPRVVSHVAHLIPELKESGVRQAVVRIESRQSLARVDAAGEVVEEAGEERTVKEYVVIQRLILRGQEQEWKVWGMAEESDWRELLARS